MRTTPDERRRRKDLATIHLGAKALAMEEDTYRQMLRTVAGAASARDLDEEGRRAVIEHLRSRGFKSERPAVQRTGRPRPSADREPMVRKVYAILHEAGREASYADAIAKRMAGVTYFEWLPPDRLHALVAALMIDKGRRRGRTRTGPLKRGAETA